MPLAIFMHFQSNQTYCSKMKHSPILNAEAGLFANILTNNNAHIGNLVVDVLCGNAEPSHIYALDQTQTTMVKVRIFL